MFGAGSLGAAVAIKELIAAGKLKGTILLLKKPRGKFIWQEQDYLTTRYLSRLASDYEKQS
jgi:hypothetical protein